MQPVQSENNVIGDKSPAKQKRKVKGPEHHQHDTSQKQEKKRKKRDTEEQQESTVEHKQSEEAEGELEPPKKKHKNRTSFADPREDTQLNAQSRKGVLYSVAVAELLYYFYLSSRVRVHSDEPPIKMEIQ